MKCFWYLIIESDIPSAAVTSPDTFLLSGHEPLGKVCVLSSQVNHLCSLHHGVNMLVWSFMSLQEHEAPHQQAECRQFNAAATQFVSELHLHDAAAASSGSPAETWGLRASLEAGNLDWAGWDVGTFSPSCLLALAADGSDNQPRKTNSKENKG